jgi:hypothetical protein
MVLRRVMMVVVARGGDFEWQVAVERAVPPSGDLSAAIHHLRRGPRRRALCGFRATNLVPLADDTAWEAIPLAGRCAPCVFVRAAEERDVEDHHATRAKARLVLVRALIRALDQIDDVNAIVRGAEDAAGARDGLVSELGFSEMEAAYVLDMRVRRQTRGAYAQLKDEEASLATGADEEARS